MRAEKGFEKGAWKIIFRPKPKTIWDEANLVLSYKREILWIPVDVFEGFPLPYLNCNNLEKVVILE